MEWQLILLIIFASLAIVLLSGMPVGFGIMLITFIATSILWGGESGLRLYVMNMRSALSNFMLLPIPMFILLGEIVFQSGLGTGMLDVVDKWLGRLPGRLGLVAIGWGTLLAAISGVNMATAAMLGKVLLPDMESRGYRRGFSLGCIMGGGGLAMIIPPSGLAVLLGALGEIPIGKLLISGILPGLVMAALMCLYIVGLSWFRPSVAPSYAVASVSFSEKVRAAVHLIPLGVIIFLVLGLMFLGIGTPTEAAAAGATGAFFLAAVKGRLTWDLVKRVTMGTVQVTVMICMLIAAASTFSQILAYTGISENLSKLAISLPLSPMLILIFMQFVLLFLGCFLDPLSIMMITIPVYMPIIRGLGFDPVWYGLIYLINLDVSFMTPPFGMTLFIMKGVAPAGTSMMQIYRAAVPFILIDLIAIGTIMVFPQIALVLPDLLQLR